MSVVLSDEAIVDRLQRLCAEGCGIEIQSSTDSTWDVRIDFPPGHEASDGEDPLGSFTLVEGLGLRSVLLKALLSTPKNNGREVGGGNELSY